MAQPARTLIEALERLVDRHEIGYSYVTGVTGDDAIHFRSFHALYRRANQIGSALQTHGLIKGDRLAMILPDSQQFIDTFFGALLVGVLPVPIYPPPIFFGHLETYLRHITPIVTKARPELLMTDEHIQSLLSGLMMHTSLRSILTLDALVHDIAADHVAKSVAIRPEDTAFLQFTSGSTSGPKGVCLSHANLLSNVEGIAGKTGLQTTPEDYCVSWLPLFHDMGLIAKVIMPLYAGFRGTLFIPPAPFIRKPIFWLQQISAQQGTITFAPNFAYNFCVNRVGETIPEALDLSSLRVAGCGAEPIRYEVLAAFARKYKPYGFRSEAFMPCYGLAEHTLAATASPIRTGVIADWVLAESLTRGEAVPADASEAPDSTAVVSCGRVLPGHACKIVDADGNPLPERRVGQILLRGPSVMQGYFEDPEATAATLCNGWLHTGDLGYLVGENLYVCGRAKDLIIVYGHNYHPQDLEWEAENVEGIRKACVVAFGFEDAELGRDRVVVAAETTCFKECHAQLRQMIRQRIREGLGVMLDHVLLLPPGTVPKTTSGKIQRTRSRELFLSGQLQLFAKSF